MKWRNWFLHNLQTIELITGGSSYSANRRAPPPPDIFSYFFLSRNKKKTFTESNKLRELFFDHDRCPLRQTAVPWLIFWIRPWILSKHECYKLDNIQIIHPLKNFPHPPERWVCPLGTKNLDKTLITACEWLNYIDTNL